MPEILEVTQADIEKAHEEHMPGLQACRCPIAQALKRQYQVPNAFVTHLAFHINNWKQPGCKVAEPSLDMRSYIAHWDEYMEAVPAKFAFDWSEEYAEES